MSENASIVIVTGSRDADEEEAHEAIRDFCGKIEDLYFDIWHGGCPYGADYAADQFALNVLGRTPVVFRADWDANGKAAGPIRNAEMFGDAARRAGSKVYVLALMAERAENRGTRNAIQCALSNMFDVTIKWVKNAPKGRGPRET